jgi:glyoxylase-like metal-dependent hydrolase (beta-lactamase superfamily II)
MIEATTKRATTVDRIKHADGCAAYVVTDEASREALVVDPRLDQVGAIQERLRARGAKLRWVVDTHTHADHLTGARTLAGREGAELLAHARSKLAAPARRVQGGDVVRLGGTAVEVLDAPGHTPDSLALRVDGHLFTGDALFVGGAGRTDFLGGSASDLFDTLRRFEALPEDTIVHPGHDYVNEPASTIGREKAGNPLLAERERASLVARLDVKGPQPANMPEILRFNLGADADSPTVSPRDLAARLAGGAPLTLVDVRGPLEFESERLAAARNIPLADLPARLDEVPAGEVVVVCRTGVRATIAAQTMRRQGREVRVLEGGLVAWRKEGLPLREGKKHLALDRQVQLVVGSAVLVTAVLGAFVSPWFLAITAFFGAGLTFAGATGTCGRAVVLQRAPWNRGAAGGATCAAPAAAAPVCATQVGPGPTCAAGGAQAGPTPTCAVGGPR